MLRTIDIIQLLIQKLYKILVKDILEDIFAISNLKTFRINAF